MILKISMILSAVTFLLSSGPSAYAHSGGTDSYGCHTNHSTGVYHCHNPKGYKSADSSKTRVPASVSNTDDKNNVKKDSKNEIHKNHSKLVDDV